MWAATAEPVRADKATDDFNLGVGLYRKERWDLAAETFDQFLKAYPGHPRENLARLYLGLALNTLQKYEPAREQFLIYLEKEPDNRNAPDARYRIGECSYYLKEYPTAIAQLSEYLKLHDNHKLHHWGRLLLADAHNQLGQWAEAEAALKILLQRSPPVQLAEDASMALGRAYEEQKKYDQARDVFQELVNSSSTSIQGRALLRIGAIHFATRNYAESATAYDAVHAKNPGSAIAHSAALNAGLSLFRLQKFDDAIERFDRVPDDSATAPQALFLKGISQQKLGLLKEASDTLTAAYVNAEDAPIAAEILFERAQLKRLQQDGAAAAQMYTDLADRWPDSAHVADALFNAAEIHLQRNDAVSTSRLLGRLRSDFPEVAAEIRVQVLFGRVFMLLGKSTDAATLLNTALGESKDPDDRQTVIARYYLVRAFHESEQYQNALTEFGTLSPHLDKPEFAELQGAFAVAAIDSLHLKDYESALSYSAEYLTRTPDGKQTADVLAAKAVASAHLMDFEQTQKDISRLVDQFSDIPQTWTAVLQTAEIAWKHEHFAAAEPLFGLTAIHTDPKTREAGLSGQAWCRYRLERFAEAAETFRLLADEFPETNSGAEAAYMHALSLTDSGEDAAAVAAFLELLGKYEATPKTEFADTSRVPQFAFDAGKKAAQLLGTAGKIDEANATWERLVTAFSTSDSLDEVMDEWAYLNLSHERFEQADDIYRQLLDRFPESRFAGQARLSLAESDIHANRMNVARRELQAIMDEPLYGASEKEKALFHLIDINAASRAWPDVIQQAKRFAAEFKDSTLLPKVQLLYADGLLDTAITTNDNALLEQADAELHRLRKAVVDGNLKPDEWTERIWVVLAEVGLAARRYETIDGFQTELENRVPDSRFLFQMWDVQGRRWKNRAEPDFAKARQYFQKAIQDETGRGTETAAKCQFLIAETFLMEKELNNAIKEYYRVYLNYPYNNWRARGLFQAAGLEAQTKKRDAAIRSYKDLLTDFPDSELAASARERLTELQGASESSPD